MWYLYVVPVGISAHQKGLQRDHSLPGRHSGNLIVRAVFNRCPYYHVAEDGIHGTLNGVEDDWSTNYWAELSTTSILQCENKVTVRYPLLLPLVPHTQVISLFGAVYFIKAVSKPFLEQPVPHRTRR